MLISHASSSAWRPDPQPPTGRRGHRPVHGHAGRRGPAQQQQRQRVASSAACLKTAVKTTLMTSRKPAPMHGQQMPPALSRSAAPSVQPTEGQPRAAPKIAGPNATLRGPGHYGSLERFEHKMAMEMLLRMGSVRRRISAPVVHSQACCTWSPRSQATFFDLAPWLCGWPVPLDLHLLA